MTTQRLHRKAADMKLDSKRLRSLIEQRGFKQADLARKLNCSGKTIGRWLKGESNPPSATIHNLSQQLGVDVEVLTGEAPMPERKSGGANAHRSRVGADVSARTRNAFILAKARYGVTQSEIIELAPLMFTLIAEGSLEYRRSIVEEAKQHIDRLEELSRGHSSYLSPHRAVDGLCDEQDSIAEKDIFGEKVGSDAYELGYCQPLENPFFKYLEHLRSKLSDDAVIKLEDEEDIYVQRVPAFSLFHKESEKLTDGDETLAGKVASGTVDLGKMPKNLPRDKRVGWIRDAAKDAEKEVAKFLEELAI